MNTIFDIQECVHLEHPLLPKPSLLLTTNEKGHQTKMLHDQDVKFLLRLIFLLLAPDFVSALSYYVSSDLHLMVMSFLEALKGTLMTTSW